MIITGFCIVGAALGLLISILGIIWTFAGLSVIGQIPWHNGETGALVAGVVMIGLGILPYYFLHSRAGF